MHIVVAKTAELCHKIAWPTKLDKILASREATAVGSIESRLTSAEGSVVHAEAFIVQVHERIDGLRKELDSIGRRLDRIERRLELTDAPPR